MSAPACGSCTAPVPDGYLCSGCTRDLAELLLLAASITPDLDDAIARLLKRGSGGRRSETEAPLPVDLAASDAATMLKVCLFHWVSVIVLPWPAGQPCAPEDAPAHTIESMARWLAVRRGRIRQHARAAGAHREIRTAVHRALAVIDRPAERAPAGMCDNCGRQLLAELGADTVRCGCGMTALALQDKRRERAAAADVLGTAGEISGALARIGIMVPRGTITSWASRGRLVPRPGGVYALSDVLALHAQSQARVRG
jgi:hypothetical protein